MRKNSFIKTIGGICMLVGTFYAGGYFGPLISSHASASVSSYFGASSTPVEDADLSEFWRVWHLLDEKFVYATSTDTIDTDARVQGAIKGMVDAFGDDYTMYMPPKKAEDFAQEMSGEFGGVGMEVGLRDDVITVIAPLEGTPAKEAGILAGDRIVAIDSVSTKGMTVDDAVEIIRGEKGTDVTLTIYTAGDGDTHDVVITRDIISIPTVDTEIQEGVFIIRLYTFNQIAHAKFIEALREYVESGSRKMIIDLRGNPGGYMNTAIDIASVFLDEGEVVLRERVGNEGQEIEHRATKTTLGKYMPKDMIVLIDGGSASASEILAGALQEHGVARIVGTQSFGKGTVQELLDLDSSASLKVTIARWFTPHGVSINKIGLTPDIEVEMTVEDVLEGNDLQLKEALKQLR